MHAEQDFKHVKLQIQMVLSIRATHIIQPRLHMGIEWNRAFVIPPHIVPMGVRGEKLLQSNNSSHTLPGKDSLGFLLTTCNVIVHISPHNRKIIEVPRGKPCQQPHLQEASQGTYFRLPKVWD